MGFFVNAVKDKVENGGESACSTGAKLIIWFRRYQDPISALTLFMINRLWGARAATLRRMQQVTRPIQPRRLWLSTGPPEPPQSRPRIPSGFQRFFPQFGNSPAPGEAVKCVNHFCSRFVIRSYVSLLLYEFFPCQCGC
jgi:hypothetical protein